MADRLVAFARRKAEEAFTCFEQGAWADGIPRAKAALDLLARAKCTDEELAARLCTRICNGLGSAGRFGEALEFFCEHSLEVANDNVIPAVAIVVIIDQHSRQRRSCSTPY